MEIEVKERIKLKSHELFYKYGIKSITMDEIATQLGISKKTIYISYKDKDELVDAVFSHVITKNQSECQIFRSKAKNAIHEGFLAMDQVEEMYENLNPNILYDLERGHPKTFNKFLQHKYKFLYEVVGENIKRGQSEGLFREDLDNDVVIKLRLENMMLPFSQNIFPMSKYNLANLQRKLAEYYLFSIVTLKGYNLILKYKIQFNKKGL